MLSEINNRLRHVRQAVYATPTPTPELVADLQAIDNKLYDIQKVMYGDGVASRLDQGSKMSISGRISWVGYEMWNSTSAPTQTQRDAIRIAEEAFEPQLQAIKQVQNDLGKLEERLEEAGAPYTPGRSVEYGDH